MKQNANGLKKNANWQIQAISRLADEKSPFEKWGN